MPSALSIKCDHCGKSLPHANEAVKSYIHWCGECVNENAQKLKQSDLLFTNISINPNEYIYWTDQIATAQLSSFPKKYVRKYEFTGETTQYLGTTLRRIKRIHDGSLGGWIEKESNLSHDGECFVYGNSMVFGNARVSGNAWTSGHAQIFGNASVRGDAQIYGSAKVYGNAYVFGKAKVIDYAVVCDNAQVYDNAYVCNNGVVNNDARANGNTGVVGDANVPNVVASLSNKDTIKATRKYEFTGETKQYLDITLGRIRRLSDGMIGGWIEKESNLSHDGRCFVYNDAKVFENGVVLGNAGVFGRGQIHGKATVSGDALVSEDALVAGNAIVCDNAIVCNSGMVYGNAVICAIGNVHGSRLVTNNEVVKEFTNPSSAVIGVSENKPSNGAPDLKNTAIVYKDCDGKLIEAKSSAIDDIILEPTKINDLWKQFVLEVQKDKKIRYEGIDLSSNVAEHSNKSFKETTEPKEMFSSLIKSEVIDAMYRVGATQITNATQAGLLHALKDQGMEDGKLHILKEILASEAGTSLIDLAFGYGLCYIPVVSDKPKVAKLAKQFRVGGMTVVGNALIDSVMSNVLPAIGQVLSGIPKETISGRAEDPHGSFRVKDIQSEPTPLETLIVEEEEKNNGILRLL